MPVVGERYLAGRGGVQVTYADGTRIDYPAHAVVRLDRPVRRVVGRLYLLRADRSLAYEAPQFGGGSHP